MANLEMPRWPEEERGAVPGGVLSGLPKPARGSGLEFLLEPREAGDPSGALTIGQVDPDGLVVGWPPGSEPIQNLLGRISIGEGTSDDGARRHYPSGSGYDVVFHNLPTSKPLSHMTLDEVSEFQRGMTGPTAVGRYQFLRGTLADMKKYFALPGSEVFSPELQDRMARRLLERRKFNDYVDGKVSALEFQKNLATEWDSIEMPGAGLTRTGHIAHTSTTQIQKDISQIVRRK